MRVGFIGVGGIGGWLGARLAESKAAEVVLIARGPHGAALAEKGLCLRVRSGGDSGPLQETIQLPADAVYVSVAEALERRARPVDVMVLGVKSWQVREAAAEVAPLLSEGGCVVTAQNGVEAPQEAAVSIGEARVVGGVCKVIAFIAEPGVVEMQAAPAVFHFGEVFCGGGGNQTKAPTSERVMALSEAFSSCKGVVSAVAAPSTWAAIWEKAVVMCCMGPIAALCRAPIEKLFSIPETRELMRAAMLEVAQCAVAAGHLLEEEAPALVDGLVSRLSQTPPGTTPSTLRDIVTGRPSELHELTGGIQRAGRALGVPTPTHDFVLAALLPQERRARGLEPYELMGVPGGAPHVPLRP